MEETVHMVTHQVLGPAAVKALDTWNTVQPGFLHLVIPDSDYRKCVCVKNTIMNPVKPPVSHI